MLRTSNINDSSFIRSSASMPLLKIERESTVAQENIGKTAVGRRIQQTTTPKFSLINKIKEFFYTCFSYIKRQRKIETVSAGQMENSLTSLRSEFEKSLAKKEEKINSLEQAYDRNNHYINRNLRTILAVSENLTDLQQRTQAKWIEIQNRLEKLEQQPHVNDQLMSQKSSREMAVQTEESSTRQGSFESRSSMSSESGHGIDGAIVPVKESIHSVSAEQRALTAGTQPLALMPGEAQRALMAGSRPLALMPGEAQRALMAGSQPLALMPGEAQRALMAGPQPLALMPGEAQQALMAGPQPLALMPGEAQRALMAGPQPLALMPGEAQRALMAGSQPLALMPGEAQRALMAGPQPLALMPGEAQRALMAGPQPLALMPGEAQRALMAGSQPLALMPGEAQRALMAGPQPLALMPGEAQQALMAGPEPLALTAGHQPLALTAGESVVEQRLGNPYELLGQSAKFNAMAAQSAIITLPIPREGVTSARALQQSLQSPAEKLAVVQAAAKKVISNQSSTQEARSAAIADVMQAQREVKIGKKLANRKRRIAAANNIKKNK